jgi:hypothetical protein
MDTMLGLTLCRQEKASGWDRSAMRLGSPRRATKSSRKLVNWASSIPAAAQSCTMLSASGVQ